MHKYEFGFGINASNITYGTIGYKSFEVREVLINNINTGEFHIKITDGSNPLSAIKYFQAQLPGCEVGLIDPEGILNLEYPIFLIVKNTMILGSINDIFTEIDSKPTN